MPELPEVEITARRLDAALRGAEVESAVSPGMVALKSIRPPLSSLVGREISGVDRIGKMPVVRFGPGPEDDEGELSLLVHMMSAGRLQIFDKRASLKDRASRVLIRITDGRELRLREFGTKQRAWVRLTKAADLPEAEMVSTLGPDAWPAPPLKQLAKMLEQSGHLHSVLRDQRTIAGIGRSWVDELLWEAKLSPFKKASELDGDQISALHGALGLLGSAIDHYEEVVGETIPDKMPIPLQVHRHEGDPCPRCGTPIAAIHYAERITCYCPTEQTEGRILKDRRLSRLLK